MLAEIRPDILHARSRVPAWLAFLANRSLRIPFVTTVHGFDSVNAYSSVMTFGDRVICVSTAIRDHIRRHYRTPEGRSSSFLAVSIWNNSIRRRSDRVFMAEFSRRHGLEGRFVVTNAGRLPSFKDCETFLRAIGLLRADLPEVLGMVVGGVRKDKEEYFESLGG